MLVPSFARLMLRRSKLQNRWRDEFLTMNLTNETNCELEFVYLEGSEGQFASILQPAICGEEKFLESCPKGPMRIIY